MRCSGYYTLVIIRWFNTKTTRSQYWKMQPFHVPVDALLRICQQQRHRHHCGTRGSRVVLARKTRNSASHHLGGNTSSILAPDTKPLSRLTQTSLKSKQHSRARHEATLPPNPNVTHRCRHVDSVDTDSHLAVTENETPAISEILK